MKLLLTAVGKRVQLIEQLKKQFEVIGVDAGTEIAAKFFLDAFYQVPRYTESGYINALLEICKKESIACIIPLYEREFELLDQHRRDFKALEVELLLSSSEIIRCCNNKTLTSIFFNKHNISHPKRYEKNEDVIFPAIIKPVNGMGSQNIFKLTSQYELDFFSNYVPQNIVEELIDGDEYTIDVLCDLEGKPIYVIPRLRVEVRSGEVSKSRIILDRSIIEATEYVLRCLNEYKNEQGIGVRGPMTIQCFKQPDGKITFLEINPRFGGGVPLSIEAGADYALSIKQMLEGKEVIGNTHIKSLQMIRYDQAMFIE